MSLKSVKKSVEDAVIETREPIQVHWYCTKCGEPLASVQGFMVNNETPVLAIYDAGNLIAHCMKCDVYVSTRQVEETPEEALQKTLDKAMEE